VVEEEEQHISDWKEERKAQGEERQAYGRQVLQLQQQKGRQKEQQQQQEEEVMLGDKTHCKEPDKKALHAGVRLYLTAPRNPITGAVDIFDKLRDLYRFK
jgi:hypothetical protein